MKRLPWVVTGDEFFFANEEQRKEWNARIAMGCEPEDLSLTGPLNLPRLFRQLPLLCSAAEWEAATPEQKRDFDERLIAQWRMDRESQNAADDEWDRKFSYLGQ